MTNKGGDGGEVFLVTKNIRGNGKIVADGGNGEVGGKGGKIGIFAENNSFIGTLSAKGGNSTTKLKWWENTWIQVLMLISAILGIIGFFMLYAK